MGMRRSPVRMDLKRLLAEIEALRLENEAFLERAKENQDKIHRYENALQYIYIMATSTTPNGNTRECEIAYEALKRSDCEQG
jgi:hypothetical protein